MTMPALAPVVPVKAIAVVCQGCGASAETDDTVNPDAALQCPPGSGCCPVDHDHDGTCRPVTIWGRAVIHAEGT